MVSGVGVGVAYGSSSGEKVRLCLIAVKKKLESSPAVTTGLVAEDLEGFPVATAVPARWAAILASLVKRVPSLRCTPRHSAARRRSRTRRAESSSSEL